MSPAELTVAPVDEPENGPAVEPAAGSGTGPLVGPDNGPVVGLAFEPVVGPTLGPDAGSIVKPVVEPTVEPATKPAVGPDGKPTVRLVVGPVVDQAAEPVDGPVKGIPVRPAARSSAGPVVGPVDGSAVGPVVEPVGPFVGPVGPVTEPFVGPGVEFFEEIFGLSPLGDITGNLMWLIIEKTPINVTNSLFTSRVENYFTGESMLITAIMERHIEREDLDLFNRGIHALLDWLQNTYLPFRSRCNNKQEVHNLLACGLANYAQPIVQQLHNASSKHSVMCVFAMVGSIYISMLQELVNGDPEAEKPENSLFWPKLQESAEVYAEHLSICYQELWVKRENWISNPNMESNTFGENSQTFTVSWKDQFCEPFSGMYTPQYNYEDSITIHGSDDGSECDKLSDFLSGVMDSRYQYITKVEFELEFLLNNPLMVVDTWKSCIQKKSSNSETFEQFNFPLNNSYEK